MLAWMSLIHTLEVTVKKQSRRLFVEIVNRLFLDICPLFTFNSLQFNRTKYSFNSSCIAAYRMRNYWTKLIFSSRKIDLLSPNGLLRFNPTPRLKTNVHFYATFLTCLESNNNLNNTGSMRVILYECECLKYHSYALVRMDMPMPGRTNVRHNSQLFNCTDRHRNFKQSDDVIKRE